MKTTEYTAEDIKVNLNGYTDFDNLTILGRPAPIGSRLIFHLKDWFHLCYSYFRGTIRSYDIDKAGGCNTITVYGSNCNERGIPTGPASEMIISPSIIMGIEEVQVNSSPC